MLFPEMGWRAPQDKSWVSDLANVGLPPPLPPRKREKKLESHAVKSSKRGLWFPEIKNKARGRGAIGAAPSCTWGKHMLTFKKQHFAFLFLVPEPRPPNLVSGLIARGSCYARANVSSWEFKMPSPVACAAVLCLVSCHLFSCIQATLPSLEPSTPFQFRD